MLAAAWHRWTCLTLTVAWQFVVDVCHRFTEVWNSEWRWGPTSISLLYMPRVICKPSCNKVCWQFFCSGWYWKLCFFWTYIDNKFWFKVGLRVRRWLQIVDEDSNIWWTKKRFQHAQNCARSSTHQANESKTLVQCVLRMNNEWRWTTVHKPFFSGFSCILHAFTWCGRVFNKITVACNNAPSVLWYFVICDIGGIIKQWHIKCYMLGFY